MIPRKLLEELAPFEPYNDDSGGCTFCRKAGPDRMYAGRYLTDHEPGCPWIKARRKLGDKIPEQRAHWADR